MFKYLFLAYCESILSYYH